MNNEKEMERHNKVLESIRNATKKEDLPNVTLSSITRYLAQNIHFDNKRVSQTAFRPIVDAFLENNCMLMPDVKDIFIKVLKDNYPGKTDEECEEKFNQFSGNNYMFNYIIEISSRAAKIQEFQEKQDLEEHERTLKQIRNANEISELPKVGRGTLNREIQNNTITDFTKKIPMARLERLTNAIFEEKGTYEIEEIIMDICKEEKLDEEQTSLMSDQIMSQLLSDKKIGYLVEEVKQKNDKVLVIYRREHEETMDNIKNARRISQLPQNLTFSSLTAYLSGNTTIYPKGKKISTTDFQNLTQLILDGESFDSSKVQDELKEVVKRYYPEKEEEAYNLLLDKLSRLPRTYYLRDEINYSQERQKEFVGRQCSNVNVYFIPNPKSPIEGGRFYNCYINRVQNLNLDKIIPLNLDEIVPEDMDVDSIEWYIQEYYDDTFKAAGGIILNKDETIGQVTVFQPSEGKIGITPEEQKRYEEIEQIGKKVKEIIKNKNEKAKKFEDLQNAYIQYQKETDDELKDLEERINELLRDGKSDNSDQKNNSDGQR